MVSKGKPFELTVDQEAIQRVVRALKAEEDGKLLRKELTVKLKDAVGPGVSKVQGQLKSIPHNSRSRSSPPLGAYLAGRVKPQVRLSGRSTGVAVRVPQTPSLRGFTMAARWLNRKSWRHKVFGRTKQTLKNRIFGGATDVWVTQQSPIPGYFDDTLAEDKPLYRDGVVAALEAMARRVTRSA